MSGFVIAFDHDQFGPVNGRIRPVGRISRYLDYTGQGWRDPKMAKVFASAEDALRKLGEILVAGWTTSSAWLGEMSAPYVTPAENMI